MNKSTFFTGQPIFSQLIKLIPRSVISLSALNHQSDRYCKKFDTYHHLITMLYACYQHCTSLREVDTGDFYRTAGKISCPETWLLLIRPQSVSFKRY